MNRIKELRKLLGIKQIDLCKRIGVTQGAFSGWENGNYEPDIKSIKKLAEIFEVSIDYLLDAKTNVFMNNKNTTDNSMLTQIEDLNEGSKKELEKYIELLKLKEISESNKNTTSTPTG